MHGSGRYRDCIFALRQRTRPPGKPEDPVPAHAASAAPPVTIRRDVTVLPAAKRRRADRDRYDSTASTRCL